MRTIKEEEVDLSDYRNFEDAYKHIRRFIMDVHMTKCIHFALGYLTPAEFEAVFIAANEKPATPFCPTLWVNYMYRFSVIAVTFKAVEFFSGSHFAKPLKIILNRLAI